MLVATGLKILQRVLPSSQPAGTMGSSQLVATMYSTPFFFVFFFLFVSLRACAF